MSTGVKGTTGALLDLFSCSNLLTWAPNQKQDGLLTHPVWKLYRPLFSVLASDELPRSYINTPVGEAPRTFLEH